MNRRGFTLIELLVSLVLVGVVTGAIYTLLLNNQRIYRQQVERVELNATLRAAVAILPSELREASATDTIGGDLIAITASSITYKAMRSLYLLCGPATNSGSTGSVTLFQDPRFGLRALDAARDSVLIFAEGDPATRGDNHWLHANVRSITLGTSCPGTTPSVTVDLTHVNPVGSLAGVTDGAPLRGYEVVQFLSYTDTNGDLWIGGRQYSKSGGWSTTQPLLGPLAASGLQFTYLDTVGVATTVPADVARIGVTVIGETVEPVRASDGTTRVLVDTLTTFVALRNNAK